MIVLIVLPAIGLVTASPSRGLAALVGLGFLRLLFGGGERLSDG